RVLPDPVGATTSVSSPRSIASQAPTCAAVGASNDSVNHAVVAGEKDDGRSRRGAAIAPLWTAAPTTPRPRSVRAGGRVEPPDISRTAWQDGRHGGPDMAGPAHHTTKG